MDSSGGKRRGLRCQICTGCGLCPGVTPFGRKVAVVTADGLAGSKEEILAISKVSLAEKNTRLVAVDVGTTTIAMLLYGRDGSVVSRHVCVNPQTVYGADVLSRICAAGNAEDAARMRSQVLQVLKQGIHKFTRLLEEGENLRLMLAANTTMVYLLMGWDVEPLGHAPFRADHLSAVETEVYGVPCFVFPGSSAFVGGDIAAGMYACRMAEREEIVLLVDLGTNGEMVLGNCRRRVACATAAGPAFEGGVNKGVWGADMVSLLAALLREKAMDETGLLAQKYFEKGIRVGNVTVTQQAIRSVQLAKAAIAVGIAALLDRYGISAKEVDRVVLAGGFGYYLDPEAAAQIGLLPQGLAKKAVTGGNTALSGAFRAGCRLLEKENRKVLAEELQRLAGDTEVINLAQESGFQEMYIHAMGFSNTFL